MRRPVVAALAADAAAVLLFATVGRASHDEGITAVGVLQTAWPFLAGVGAGWAAVRVRRGRWPLEVGDGVVVWLAGVAGAMLLRRATGAGTDPAFVVVATVVLGMLLLGWRAVRRRWRPTSGRRRSARPGAARGR